MEIIHEEERKALGHYKNTDYYDSRRYINASMSAETLKKIIASAGIDLNKCEWVLDFGCGTGETLKWLGERTKKACFYGIDYSVERIAVAEQNVQAFKERAILVNGDVNVWLKDATFKYDLIIAFEIIEHLKDSDNIVKKLKSMLTIGGKLLCTIPYQEKPNDIHLAAYKDQADVVKRLGLKPMPKFPMRFPNQNVFVYNKNGVNE